MERTAWIGGLLYARSASAGLAQGVAPPTPERSEFFESRVRPVLAERCYSCHGTKAQFGGVRLDSPGSLLRPTAKGRLTVVPGNPAQSAVILAIRYDGAIKMPPQGRLAAREIEALTQWVKMGAPWPTAVVKGTHEGEAALLEAARKHWSLRPVTNPPVPTVQDSAWVRNPIDAFIRSAQEAKGLAPNPPADRRTLLRRVTYDLTGLPPTPAETEAFLADTSPAAYEKLSMGCWIAALWGALGPLLAGHRPLRRYARLPFAGPARRREPLSVRLYLP